MERHERGNDRDRDRDYDNSRDMYDDSFRDSGDDRGGKGGFYRKKACRFCTEADYIMDYKNIRILQNFISEHGKIVPMRVSGNCARHQRQLTQAIKRARVLAFVGFTSMNG